MDLTLFRQNIETALKKAETVSISEVKDLIAKAGRGQGLSLEEAAKLLNKAETELLVELAIKVKESTLGRRITIFAPLYLTNICKNNCLYCGFRFDNKEMLRRRLNSSEIKKEADILVSEGQRILLLICGEDPKTASVDYLKQAIEIVLGSGISRVNIEVAPLETEEYALLKEAGVKTYILFQETYHPQTYKIMHPSGPKADFSKRIMAPLKAIEGGFREVGLGILLGLGDYRYDFLGLVAHSYEIKERFGFYPASFSLPRLKPALNAPLQYPPSPVTDLEFQKLAALLRLTFPDSEIILTTRETPLLRDKMIHSGISMFSAGSKTYPGGYSEKLVHAINKEQFYLDDLRSLKEIVSKLISEAVVPSFAEKASLEEALLSFAVYMSDYAEPITYQKGKALIVPMLKEEQINSLLSEKWEKVSSI